MDRWWYGISPHFTRHCPLLGTLPHLQIYNSKFTTSKSQGKGTSNHVMPLGNRFYSQVRKGSILFGHGGTCSIFPFTSTFMWTKAKFELDKWKQYTILPNAMPHYDYAHLNKLYWCKHSKKGTLPDENIFNRPQKLLDFSFFWWIFYPNIMIYCV